MMHGSHLNVDVIIVLFSIYIIQIKPGKEQRVERTNITTINIKKVELIISFYTWQLV